MNSKTFKFLASIVPEPVMSKKSKAFLISFFCDSVSTYWLLRSFLRICAELDCGFGCDCVFIRSIFYKLYI